MATRDHRQSADIEFGLRLTLQSSRASTDSYHQGAESMMHSQIDRARPLSGAPALNVCATGKGSDTDDERLMRLSEVTANIWKRWMVINGVVVAALQIFGLAQFGWVRVVIGVPVLSVIVWVTAELAATHRMANDGVKRMDAPEAVSVRTA